ncbi:MAG: DUF512 domain-containing protein [Ruminococcaceae bacterium]|nr:DUF512 domain-containing protein [Oscillospiraceae bacterium]
MGAKIVSVARKSPAYKAGIRAGDELLSVNGHVIRDVLDYKFYGYEESVALTLQDREVTLKKGAGEDIGITFESYLMDKAKRCANRCIFCFIDQLPPNMRETLYFKDDDARMSFLLGNYITLTNLSEEDVERMIRMRINPINISVHATDPDVRVQMLRNPNAGRCMELLRRFADADMMLNCQIVACPGVNDGEVLRNSLRDLMSLWPAINSVSVVPVGLTKYRERLYPITPVNRECAREIISIVEEFSNKSLKENGTRVVYPSDELFIKAQMDIPDAEYYEEYPQLENGVGMIALLRDEFHKELAKVSHKAKVRPFTVATGVSAAPFIAKLIDELAEKCDNVISWNVVPVINRFFGENVNVAGLITGEDLISALKGKELGERVLIPDVMLRHQSNVFLDDVTVEAVERELGISVRVVPSGGKELLSAILEKKTKGVSRLCRNR